MDRAHPNPADLLAHLFRERAGNPQLHQLGIAEHGVEWRAQLVGHYREELRLRPAGRLRFETSLALERELLRALLRLLAIGDVAERDDLHLLVVPFRLNHSQLGVDYAAASALHDVDFSGLAYDNWKAEGRTD